MNPNKALWEKGDFTQIAEAMRESGTRLVSKLNINGNSNVMDLGCGDGTTALPAARLGAKVQGVDIARNLVEAGNLRAKAENLNNCSFEEGDASNLNNIADDTFDVVISIFGAMFAPKPFDVAREIVRVTRPGGRIIMGNWIPNDPTLVAQILKICAAHTPPPPAGFVSPMTWGIERDVTERFVAAGASAQNITFEHDTFTFAAPITPHKFMKNFKEYYGPTMNAFEAAEKDGKAASLENELDELFRKQNQSTQADTISIPATFLRVTVEV